MNKETTDVEKLSSMIKDIKFTMMTTVSEDGSLHSRPMATLNVDNFEGTLWFFSKKNSPKNNSLENDQHVNLAYSHPNSQSYISVSGRATISTDKQKIEQLWEPMLKAWFPEGINDPEITLIAVNVESAEIWSSPPNKVIKLVDFVKAAVTGRPNVQDISSQHIDLQ